MTTKLPATFSYFGAKHGLCRRYPPPVGGIVEPFAGSAGYSHLYAEGPVLLVDKDPNISALWRYVLSATPDQIRALPLFEEGDTTIDDLGPLPPGAEALIGFWLHRAGPSPRTRISGWCRDRRYAQRFWGASVRETVAKNAGRIAHWRFLEGDYRTCPDVEATWFVDPPYVKAGGAYRENQINHGELADWCRSRRGLVIVCEQAGADWLDFLPLCESQATRKKPSSAPTSREVVYVSQGGVNLTGEWLNGAL